MKKTLKSIQAKYGVLSEQVLTPAPAPKFKPGQLTDPNFQAAGGADQLSPDAKHRRFIVFKKKMEKEFEKDLKKPHDEYVAAGDQRYERFLKDLKNVAKFGTYTLPKRYLEHISQEIDRGNYPKTLKEWWEAFWTKGSERQNIWGP